MIAQDPSPLDRSFAALAHPVRRRIVESTTRRGRGVTELAQQFDISLPAVSKHLRVLEDAGLITREVSGRDHLIRAEPRELERVRRWIERQTTFWRQALAQLKADLENDRS